MTKRLVLWLVRKRLRLKEREPFQFVNQKTDAVYYFTKDAIMKAWRGDIDRSSVSLNWLLDDECAIRKCFSEKETTIPTLNNTEVTVDE